MKRKVIRVSQSVVCILLIGCTAISVYSLRTSQKNGGYSDVCNRISPEAKEWALDRFGDCPCFEELLRQLDIYAIEHFEYADIPLFLGMFQQFDLDGFLFGEKQFQGVCFDFSCWVKTCVLVWSEKNDIPVQVYVLDVKGQGYAHSYNVFFYQGGTYTLDVTSDHTHAKKGKKPIGPLFWFDASIEQIAQHYNEKPMIWR